MVKVARLSLISYDAFGLHRASASISQDLIWLKSLRHGKAITSLTVQEVSCAQFPSAHTKPHLHRGVYPSSEAHVYKEAYELP